MLNKSHRGVFPYNLTDKAKKSLKLSWATREWQSFQGAC